MLVCIFWIFIFTYFVFLYIYFISVDGTLSTRHRGQSHGLELILNTQLDNYLNATDDVGFQVS